MALSVEEMEARLRAFYETHNPGNEQNITSHYTVPSAACRNGCPRHHAVHACFNKLTLDTCRASNEIVRKYQGKEAALCARLKKKYGVAPDLLGPSPSTDASTPSAGSQLRAKPSPTPPMPDAVYDANYKPVRVAPTVGGALDFRSASFDALAALRSRESAPPVAGLLPLDNIFKCRHLLPLSDPNYQKLVVVSTVKKTPAPPVSSKPLMDKQPLRTPALFEQLADTYLDGPFTVLRRCFLDRRRVRVVIRRVNSVRGYCSGILKAFDKHMNMVLLDVREVLIPPLVYAQRDRGEVECTALSVADEHRNRAFTVRSHAKQLFVRGDNVVMVMEDAGVVPTARK